MPIWTRLVAWATAYEQISASLLASGMNTPANPAVNSSEAGIRQTSSRLRALTAEYPLRERFWQLLMRALEGSGRPAEALEVYAQARKVLADELGVDPGADLQQLHQAVNG